MYLFELFRLQDVASQHVSMALRNNDRFQVTKPLPDVGGQLRKCYYLVKDVQEPKVQKILSWTDFGPFKSLDDKTLQSLAKSLVSLEVNICWFVHHIMLTFLLSQSFSIHSLRAKSSWLLLKVEYYQSQDFTRYPILSFLWCLISFCRKVLSETSSTTPNLNNLSWENILNPTIKQCNSMTSEASVGKYWRLWNISTAKD